MPGEHLELEEKKGELPKPARKPSGFLSRFFKTLTVSWPLLYIFAIGVTCIVVLLYFAFFVTGGLAALTGLALAALIIGSVCFVASVGYAAYRARELGIQEHNENKSYRDWLDEFCKSQGLDIPVSVSNVSSITELYDFCKEKKATDAVIFELLYRRAASDSMIAKLGDGIKNIELKTLIAAVLNYEKKFGSGLETRVASFSNGSFLALKREILNILLKMRPDETLAVLCEKLANFAQGNVDVLDEKTGSLLLTIINDQLGIKIVKEGKGKKRVYEGYYNAFAMHFPGFRGKIEPVNLMSQTNNGDYFLHFAVRYLTPEALRQLVKENQDQGRSKINLSELINKKNLKGETPLTLAIKLKGISFDIRKDLIAELLKIKSIDLNETNANEDKNKRFTPLQFVFLKNNPALSAEEMDVLVVQLLAAMPENGTKEELKKTKENLEKAKRVLQGVSKDEKHPLYVDATTKGKILDRITEKLEKLNAKLGKQESKEGRVLGTIVHTGSPLGGLAKPKPLADLRPIAGEALDGDDDEEADKLTDSSDDDLDFIPPPKKEK